MDPSRVVKKASALHNVPGWKGCGQLPGALRAHMATITTIEGLTEEGQLHQFSSSSLTMLYSVAITPGFVMAAEIIRRKNLIPQKMKSGWHIGQSVPVYWLLQNCSGNRSRLPG